jgi:iron complex transport system permease protein
MNRRSKQKLMVLAMLAVLALLVLPGAAMVGAKIIPAGAILDPAAGGVESEIFWRVRAPRVCISFLAGAGLALSGLVFQAIFRNPLAEPFTLGVASGASLGAALYVRFGLVSSVLAIAGMSVSAFAGAVLSILLVYGLTRLRGGLETTSMLLAGIAISCFFSSVILFAQYMSDFADAFRILRWLIGGLEVVGFESVRNMAPFVVAGCVVVLYLTHDLNLMTIGEELAISRGVRAATTRKSLFFAASLMVGGVVATCGPIGFVGVMVPHFCRLLVGADHRYLIPATILFGGVFLTLCDMISRVLIAPAEMPVGIITSLLGGPFFIWLLTARGRREGVGLQ